MERMLGRGKETGAGDRNSGTPLRAAVDSYLSPVSGAAPLRMHVPGHKGGHGAPPALRARWGRAVFADDLTEVPGLDDLAAPAEAIARSQEASARRLGAAAAHYLVQGTTGGLAALALAITRAFAGASARVLLPRHVHRAFVAAVVLTGLDPEFVPMRLAGGRPCGPDTAHLHAALDGRQDPAGRRIAAVFDTYPSINGVAHDLAAIADTCRRFRVPLFVDAAHAGLFGLDPLMPAAPLALGADSAVVSAHKTMGSLGQSSLLLHAPAAAASQYFGELGPALRLVQTTSPSYPLLLSLEAAVEHITSPTGRAAVRAAVEAGAAVRAKLARLGVQCWEPDASLGLALDPLRITIDTMRLGRDGYAVSAELRRRAGVQVEGADWRSVLVVLGPGDGPAEGQRLVDAVAGLVREAGVRGAAAGEDATARAGRLSRLCEQVLLDRPARILPPREAWFKGGAPVPLREAAGRVAAEPLSPYPPGVAVVWPGEVISPGAVELVEEVLRAGGAVHGVVGASPGLVRIPVLGRVEG